MHFSLDHNSSACCCQGTGEVPWMIHFNARLLFESTKPFLVIDFSMCQKRSIHNKSRHLQCSVILEGVQLFFLRYLARCDLYLLIECWYEFLLEA